MDIQVIVTSEAGEEEKKLYNQSTCGIPTPELHAKMNIEANNIGYLQMTWQMHKNH